MLLDDISYENIIIYINNNYITYILYSQYYSYIGYKPSHTIKPLSIIFHKIN